MYTHVHTHMYTHTYTSPVAVAIYDYEAMADPGEEDNLEFEEGDIIEVRMGLGEGGQ